MVQYHRPVQPGASLARLAVPRSGAYQPIPAAYAQGRTPPAPWDVASILTAGQLAAIVNAGSLAFHCVGDTGGVKNPVPQHQVAQGLMRALQNAPPAGAASLPSLLYHLGDVIYFNGETDEYYSQFYEPYDQYPLPIVAIPGNHDGDPLNAQAISLEGFYRNFLATPPAGGGPVYTPESKDSGRPAMELPFFYHCLTTPFATFIGLYSNVPEHGELDADQRAWFHDAMAKADPAKALIVAVHHPVYSFDTYHSGSPTMAQELQDAINASGRLPNAVFSAHVHNYQRIEKTVLPGVTIPFFVIGAGGYYNRHQLSAVPGYTDPQTEAALIAAIDTAWGFATFDISANIINGHYTIVPDATQSWSDPAAYNPTFDVFSYSAKPLFVPNGQSIELLPPNGAHVPPVAAPPRHHGPKPQRGGKPAPSRHRKA